jgi:hypothetical protein
LFSFVVALVLHFLIAIYIWYMLVYVKEWNETLKRNYGNYPAGWIAFDLLQDAKLEGEWSCPRIAARVILFTYRLFFRPVSLFVPVFIPRI